MREKVFGVLLATAAVLMMAAPLIAHHGAASFDTEREITLKGTVTEWIWANPHCFLKFDGKDDTGTVRNWVVEAQNPTDMTVRGWRRTSFKVGDQVTVTSQERRTSGTHKKGRACQRRDAGNHEPSARCSPCATGAAGEITPWRIASASPSSWPRP